MIEAALFYSIITLVVYGIADALAAIPGRRLSPITIAVIIDICSVVFLGLASVFFWSTYVWNSHLLYAAAAGVVGYLGFLFFIYALQRIPVGVAAAVANAYPVLTLPLGIFLLGELVSLPAVIAISLVVIGIVGLSTKFSLPKLNGANVSTGILFSILAMAFWAINALFMKLAVAELPPFEATQAMSFTSFLVGLATFWLSGKTLSQLTQVSRIDLKVIALISFLYFFGIFMLNSAFATGELGIYAAFAGAAPFASALFAYLFIKERLSRAEWFGVLLVVVGLVVLGVVV